MIGHAPRGGVLDKALDDRKRLISRYNASKRTELDELCLDPAFGNRLRKFVATLNHFKIGDSDRFLRYFGQEHTRWLDAAPDRVRQAALRAINNHAMKVREQNGMPPLSDPLPWQDDNIFFRCKKMLRL